MISLYARLDSTNCNFVAELVGPLQAINCVAITKREQNHEDAKRHPHSPCLPFHRILVKDHGYFLLGFLLFCGQWSFGSSGLWSYGSTPFVGFWLKTTFTLFLVFLLFCCGRWSFGSNPFALLRNRFFEHLLLIVLILSELQV